MNENTDEPSSTASERVHSTCNVIAVAPDTANAASAARRERASTTAGGGSAAVSSLASTAAMSRRSSVLTAASSAAGMRRRAMMIAAASVRLKDAAVMLVQVTPSSGRNTKPEKNAPATAPNRLMAYSVPMRSPERRSSHGRMTKWRASSGSVAPISVVGISSSAAEPTKRTIDSSTQRSPNTRYIQWLSAGYAQRITGISSA